LAKVRLSGRGRRRLEGGHPWIFADDVVATEAEPGDVVAIEAPDGRTLGFGLYSSESKIRVRLFSRDEREPGPEFWKAQLARALAARRRMGLWDPRGACRLLAGDADLVPGLVIDHYAGVFVLQSGSQASDRLIPTFVDALVELCGEPTAVVDRSDASVRRLEGLEKRVVVLRGSIPTSLEVHEEGLVYEVDVLHGHKTGHYLDQRRNRLRAAVLSRGRAMLDAFCYDGLFAVRAALAGATHVLCLDQAEAALERARRNAERNGVLDKLAFERVDVMRDLRQRADLDGRFGVVVVDPPAFARNKAELEGAERGYRELNLRALRLVEPGGHMVSASCSHAMKSEHFVQVLAQAAHLSGRSVYLEELLGASPDHSALLTLPESSYLKCAFLRVE
jgi:23S rRNA (cytosine1962-C5)-methyltransferase